FAKIERDLIARGIFTSVPDLRRKLLRYITLHNTTAHPFQWSYTNPKRRVRAIRNSLSVHSRPSSQDSRLMASLAAVLRVYSCHPARTYGKVIRAAERRAAVPSTTW
ncbi:MAG: hypothetical protein ACR2OG_00950, partial [Gemmatimonadaceae bacterium]